MLNCQKHLIWKNIFDVEAEDEPHNVVTNENENGANSDGAKEDNKDEGNDVNGSPLGKQLHNSSKLSVTSIASGESGKRWKRDFRESKGWQKQN